MSTEKRLLLACAISALIFMVWTWLFPPPKPPAQPPAQVAEEAAQATEGGDEAVDDAGTAEAEVAGEPEVGAETGSNDIVEEAVAEAEEGEREQDVVLRNDVMEVVVTNRGAAISSLLLLEHESDDRSDEPLDLIQTVEDEERLLPLQLRTVEGVDDRLYAVESWDRGCRLVWSDGRGNRVAKELSIAERGYGIQVDVRTEGVFEEAFLSLGTGMRDTGPAERESRLSNWGDVVVAFGDEIERFARKKTKERVEQAVQSVQFCGFEDTYFLNVLRPETRLSEFVVVPLEHVPSAPEAGPDEADENLETAEAEEKEPERVLQVLVRSPQGYFAGQLLAAPKEFQLLHAIGGGVERTLHFGMFNFLSVLFLKALWWIYGKVGNYGWAIVVLTLGIRILLFPLVHKSTVSMRKMAKLQPKVKAIQAKYKKQKTDPQARAKMSQETMELYREEGVNPVSGCLPMLLQLPILWALYQLFLRAIELRHAPFMLWITDLSAKDPYFVTPVLMTISMVVQQKLAPQTADPQQQKIFRFMPFIFGFMFLNFPAGLVLYWLTNNVITIIQQEITLHLIGERKRPGKGGQSDKGRKE